MIISFQKKSTNTKKH